jgi:hypothetical protein
MLGLFVVGVTNWSVEGVEPKSLSMGVQFINPCDGCPPLPFIDTRGRAKSEIKEKLQCRLLRCPPVRHCLSGRIEEVSRYVVVEAAAWPSGAVHFGASGASSK